MKCNYFTGKMYEGLVHHDLAAVEKAWKGFIQYKWNNGLTADKLNDWRVPFGEVIYDVTQYLKARTGYVWLESGKYSESKQRWIYYTALQPDPRYMDEQLALELHRKYKRAKGQFYQLEQVYDEALQLGRADGRENKPFTRDQHNPFGSDDLRSYAFNIGYQGGYNGL